MNTDTSYRVFISYTGQDLEAHAEIVSDMVKRLNSGTGRNWVAIDHKFWAPTGRPSVKECMEQVERCQILIVLVAFRYGWVPTPEEGGDGESSITRLEVERARAVGLEVIPFLVEDTARWNVPDIEGLTDSRAQQRLDKFKSELRKSLAGFFEAPESLEASTLLALNLAADRIERSLGNRRAKTVIEERSDESDLIVPSYFDPDHPPSLEERLETKLPKRILSLDSAGTRTAIVLGYLERLEQLLRIRYSDAHFLLSDYFDLIGASGAASIIAAELARGRTVTEARKTFSNAMAALLSAKKLLPFTALYSPTPAQELLNEAFGKMMLNSMELKTGLAIVLTRVDTGEIWSLTNHPRTRSSERSNLLLSQVLLASVANPGTVAPVELRIGDDAGSFLSGELSVGPDPALHLFLIATGPTFPFRWRTGRRRIFLTSIGAGTPPIVKQDRGYNIISMINMTVSAMVSGMKHQSDLALAALTHEDTRELSDGARGDSAVRNARSILRYRRFDVALDAPNVSRIGLPEFADDIDSLAPSNRTDLIPAHLEIGTRAAERDMDENLFSLSFDVRPRPGDASIEASSTTREDIVKDVIE